VKRIGDVVIQTRSVPKRSRSAVGLSSLAVAAALSLGFQASVAEGRKGDISPVPGGGVKVVRSHGQTAAQADLGALLVRMRLSTKSGVVILDITVENRSLHPVQVESGNLILESHGEEAEPLSPEQYVSQVYESVKPYHIDEHGQIKADDSKNRPVKLFTPGDSTKNSLAEMMTEAEWEDGAAADRMRVSRELVALRKDPFSIGGRIEAGKQLHGRRVYQRTNVDLPMVVRFHHPLGRMTVKFDRER
jgi:hypothetical protein